MRIDPNTSFNSSPISGSEAKDPHSTIMHAYATQAFIKESVQKAMQALREPPNLLAIGDQDPEESLRQERLAYEEEEKQEAERRAKLNNRIQADHLGKTAAHATVHQLPISLPTESEQSSGKQLAS